MAETKNAARNTNGKQTEAEFLADREAQLLKKYKRIVPGSIERDPETNKLTVVIRCAAEGCDRTRRVATSDLFQVKYCEECTKARRNKARRAKAKAIRKENGETKSTRVAGAGKAKRGTRRAARPRVVTPKAEAALDEAVEVTAS